MPCFNTPSSLSAGTGTAPRNNNDTKPVLPIASLESVSTALDAVVFQRTGGVPGAPAARNQQPMVRMNPPRSQSQAKANVQAQSDLLSMIDEALWIVEDSSLEDFLLGNHTHRGPSSYYDRSNRDAPLRD